MIKYVESWYIYWWNLKKGCGYTICKSQRNSVLWKQCPVTVKRILILVSHYWSSPSSVWNLKEFQRSNSLQFQMETLEKFSGRISEFICLISHITWGNLKQIRSQSEFNVKNIREAFIWYVHKIFPKTNISYHLIRTHVCVSGG